MAGKAYQDYYWQSADGLRLHARDYAREDEGADDRPPILCIPGLTRNARDFEPVAEAFAGQWRVLCVELRGRGRSEYANDSATYVPATYVADMLCFFEAAGLDKVVALGTSLGGLITGLLAAQLPDRFAGVILNDIGPVIEPEGLARIGDYVGQGRSFPTWMHAARALREQVGATYPDYAIEDWLRLAKRLMWLGNSGRMIFDYDMRIAEPFAESDGQPEVDMWPVFNAVAGRPSLIIRGELSDILSGETVAKMQSEIAGMDAVTIARTGHAPTLDEPEALAAIAKVLAQIA